ncbi:GNAT family N-acetyltransferase [Streptomyces sp. 3211]|uniref:GNAT family N-acetyltransferase n=1 Tax=Streptomyces sp. 3211 TaxID=1964449 RepID=UPI0009A54AB0|nr:GNAT family N-acetyltransferase [Streptomyces sp. 3211]
MNIDVVKSLDGVDRDAWDALSGGSFYAGHAWTRYQEADPGSSVRYVLVREGDGQLVAGVPVYLVDSEASAMYDPARLFPDLPQQSRVMGRTVLAGNRRGYANRILTDAGADADPERKRHLTGQLVDAVNRIAAEEADGHAWWLYLGDADAEALLSFGAGSPPRLLAADCAIALPGTSFEDYLQSGSSNMRRQIRKDRDAFRAAGYTCSEIPFSACWDEISPLIASHQQHHGERSGTDFIRALMRGQAEATADAGVVHACRKDGGMVGCTLTYVTPREVSSRAYGFDYRYAAVAAEYFELLYYRPMEAAYRAGASRLHLGIGTLQPKIRRGAEVSLLWGVQTGVADGGDSGTARARNAVRWQQLADDMGGAAERTASASRFLADAL